jgi:virginiamycin B lyase
VRIVGYLLFPLLLALPTLVNAAPAGITIQEWPVPWQGTRPRDPSVGLDGRIWFVGQTGDYVGTFNPETETFERIDLSEGAGPHNVIVGSNGYIWYAGNRDRHIGRIDPKTQKILRIEMPDDTARDPHTLVEDGRGHIWFTVQFGNFVGRLDKTRLEVRLIPVPTPRAGPGSPCWARASLRPLILKPSN